MRLLHPAPAPVADDVGRGLVGGAVLGAPVALAAAAAGFPEWAETLTGFTFVFGCLLVVGLALHAVLAALHWYIDRGRSTPSRLTRSWWTGHARPIVVGGALCLGACAVLLLASGATTGDWTP